VTWLETDAGTAVVPLILLGVITATTALASHGLRPALAAP